MTVSRGRKMEQVVANGSGRNLYRLIRSTGLRKKDDQRIGRLTDSSSGASASGLGRTIQAAD